MTQLYRHSHPAARQTNAAPRSAQAREERRRREIKTALHQLQQLWGEGQQHECPAPDSHASKDAPARDAGDVKGGAA